VTWCDGYRKKSNHQEKDDGFGHAFDFQCYIPGRPDLSYDKIHMAVLIGAFLSIADSLFVYGDIKHRLRSGADWDGDTQYLEPGTFIDMPHLGIEETMKRRRIKRNRRRFDLFVFCTPPEDLLIHNGQPIASRETIITLLQGKIRRDIETVMFV
jgi:hypothetical protein